MKKQKKKSLTKRSTRWFITLFTLGILLLLPQIWLKLKYKDLIYGQVNEIPGREYAIVFGAWVNEDGSLSDVTRERVEAGIQLYQQQKVENLLFSGDNRSNKQAQEMANYAVQKGVDPNDILVDPLGIDTNDTCKHFAGIGSQGIIVTQTYHLPRTMLMCEASKINVVGLAADQLNILESRGDNWLQIYTTRVWRSTREAALTWMFVTGLYDRFSTEAEAITEKANQ
jgi:vancomycin permeability regulator SanA